METMVSGLIVLWAHRQRTDFCENDGTAINCSVRFSRVQLVHAACSDLAIGHDSLLSVLVLVLSQVEKPAMSDVSADTYTVQMIPSTNRLSLYSQTLQ
jgi:hypothetical protein